MSDETQEPIKMWEDRCEAMRSDLDGFLEKAFASEEKLDAGEWFDRVQRRGLYAEEWFVRRLAHNCVMVESLARTASHLTKTVGLLSRMLEQGRQIHQAEMAILRQELGA